MRINNKVMTIVAGVVALMALSSTGGAVAGGLITTKQIKDGAVTSAKVKNGTLTLEGLQVERAREARWASRSPRHRRPHGGERACRPERYCQPDAGREPHSDDSGR